MQLPVQVTFRHMATSPAVEERIRDHVDALERFFERITACRVVVEASSGRQRKGNLFHVRVDLTVPGREIVIKRDPSQDHAHEDVYVAIRDAFDAARRLLEDHVRTMRGDVKAHEIPAHGRVVRLFKNEGYGFIRSSEGEDVYMHQNAVAGSGFQALSEGDEVRFTVHPGEGDKGPQASTVTPIGKHHLAP